MELKTLKWSPSHLLSTLEWQISIAFIEFESIGDFRNFVYSPWVIFPINVR